MYETRCVTCEEKALQELQEQELTDKDRKEKEKKIILFKYIGESSRSAYERGWEHVNDMASLNPRSHMLKHAIIDHPGEDMSLVKFGMKIVKYCQTSFERQILESVLIQSERKHHNILNSRSEYNRCSLPRLTTKMGEDSYKEFGKEIENEKNEEIKIEKKIRELRKIKNKARLHPTKEIGSKRRKINEENKYITINEIWGKPTISTQMKNKHENQNENIPSKKLRIICWEDLEKETTTNYNKNTEKPQNINEIKIQKQDE